MKRVAVLSRLSRPVVAVAPALLLPLLLALLLAASLAWAEPALAGAPPQPAARPLAVTAPIAATAPATDTLGATVIVHPGGAAALARPIRLAGPISGLDTLSLAGVEVITAGTSFGPAVCSIAGVGCPATDCFCHPTHYWGYFYWDQPAGLWQSYPVGAASSVISQDGAIEGWVWGAYPSEPRAVTTTLQAVAALGALAEQPVAQPGAAVESLLAFGANGQANAGAPGGSSATALSINTAIAQGSAGYTRSGAAAAGKLAVALAGTGACLPAGALTPSSFYSPTLAAYSAQSGPNAWAILGALALAETVPAPALETLAAAQTAGGGWEWGPGWGADTNATALALQALIAAGVPVTSPTVTLGLTYLATAQQPDGGFVYALSGGDAPAQSDANSTAYVVQALVAAGEEPAGARWTVAGRTALDFLAARRLPGGLLEWQAGSGPNLLATQQAVPALLGRAYPLRRAAPTLCPALYLPWLGAQ